MSSLQVKKINIYPLKSGRRQEVKEVSFDTLGIENDRRWAIVDSRTRAVRTQINYEKIALITPTVTPNYIALQAPGMDELVVPKKIDPQGNLEVKLFSRKPIVIDQGKEAEEWLSAFLGNNVKLVYQPASLASNGIALVDNRRVLIASESSLNDLNNALGQRGISAYTMSRFRPNFEIPATRPYEEDEWKEIAIGEVVLEGRGQCERCQMPDIDQELGEYSDPSKTIKIIDILKEVRGTEKGLFGQYFDHKNTGLIHLDDEIKVLK